MSKFKEGDRVYSPNMSTCFLERNKVYDVKRVEGTQIILLTSDLYGPLSYGEHNFVLADEYVPIKQRITADEVRFMRDAIGMGMMEAKAKLIKGHVLREIENIEDARLRDILQILADAAI